MVKESLWAILIVVKTTILGIETSCDETSASVVEVSSGGIKILSNIISSQINIHKKYGGVVPEVASRAHLESINSVIEESLLASSKTFDNINFVAVTCGPGLSGSLVVGFSAAKIISSIFNKTLVCVNHLEGHIYANFVGQNQKKIKFPAIVLVVSGGHTQILKMTSHLKYEVLGQTKDDACGEAFDKVARILDVGYPGGPNIEKISKGISEDKYNFPRSGMGVKTGKDKDGFVIKINPDLDFSFSGLKTAVLSEVRKRKSGRLSKYDKKEIAASFQKAAIDVLVKKTIWAAERDKAKSVLLSGGVSANKELRKNLKKETKKIKVDFFVPDFELSTDNAAMIAIAGYFRNLKEKKSEVNINPNLKLVR